MNRYKQIILLLYYHSVEKLQFLRYNLFEVILVFEIDKKKFGEFIMSLRKEKGYTQKELAHHLFISDKAISKWETGLGYPDVSLLPELSNIFGVDLISLLEGQLDTNDLVGGNMKKLKFYVCPSCGNLLTGTSEASISCCGKKLQVLTPIKATESEKLIVKKVENEYFISTNHEMTKDHYITFVALLTGDSIILKKQYPEWNIQAHIPCLSHGMLIWHCNNHGLFYQLI